MTIFSFIVRNIAQRRLSSFLTMLSVALGVMIVASILKTRAELADTYQRQSEGYSLVVGPSGSPLELVLNSVYHVGQSAGLVPFSIYEEFSSPKWERFMRLAVPYAVGDSYKGYRVVASTDAIFSPEFPFPKASTTAEKFESGGPYKYSAHMLEHILDDLKKKKAGAGGDDDHDHHHHDDLPREAVLGAEVARTLGLKPGDTIRPAHGIEGKGSHDHGDWKVTGVLKMTGTPIDRVVFTNLDSFYGIAEHSGALIAGTQEPGLSAVLLFPVEVNKPGILVQLKKRTDLTVAEVGFEIHRLLEIVGNVDRIFFWVAVLVVIVGVISILVAIYNTMNERRRDIAIMRAIGAHRSTILLTIVVEACLLSFFGAILGLLLTRGLLAAVAERVAASAGLLINPWPLLPSELLLVGLVTVMGALAGLIPATKAYMVDVAKHLAPVS